MNGRLIETKRLYLHSIKTKYGKYKELYSEKSPNEFVWTIELKDTHEVVGQISIQKNYDKKETIQTIFWFLDTPYYEKEYAYEAILEVLKFMFLEVKISSILTFTIKQDKSSRKLIKKLGFQRMNTKVEEPIEVYEYQCYKGDFLKEYFRKEELYIKEDIDKDPYIKHLSDDSILNIAGLNGSGKTTATEKYQNDSNYIVIDLNELETNKRIDENI